MKKVLLGFMIAATMVACNNAADSTENAKDSIDSAATEIKENIDSAADAKKDVIDSTAEMKKDAVDSLNKKDSTK